MNRRVAIFGGSFDPVHAGHLELARRALDEAELDEVRFIPCRQSPHKAERPAASDADRLRMLQLATSKLEKSVIDPFELESSEPSVSFRTVRHLRERFPSTEWFWIVGLDQWQALPRWQRPEELAEALTFLVFAREGKPRPRPGWRMQFLHGTHPASSSAIRAALLNGRDTGDWLSPDVEAFIRTNKLYR